MRNAFSKLRHLFAFGQAQRRKRALPGEAFHVVVPEAVELPLPRSPREEISVPASINGRDLSTGRL